MAKKEMVAKIKLQCPGGQATPAPPVGPALGQHGVNIGDFVRQFNERTREANGTIIPVEVTVYADRSFEFITKSPPASVLRLRIFFAYRFFVVLGALVGVCIGLVVPLLVQSGVSTDRR